METKTSFFLFFLCTSLIAISQPKKGTWEIGGSGYWTKAHNEKVLKLKTYEINSEANYFLLKHLALGGYLTFQGEKDYTKVNAPRFHGLHVAPTLETYLLNHKIVGISIKGSINFLVSTNWDLKEKVSSYNLGPKVSLNITPTLSMYLWATYRKLNDFDYTGGFKSIAPSDNFDIRWGFSYYLHRKEKE